MRFSFFNLPLLLFVTAGSGTLLIFLIIGWLRSRSVVPRFFPKESRGEIRRIIGIKTVMLSVLLFLGFILTGAALFEPVFGEIREEVPYSGNDIMFCVDISNSMLATDTGSSRLERAKLFIRNTLAAADDSNFGITVFKGSGILAVPLTGDRLGINHFLEYMNPGYSTVPGTNVAAGLAAAASGFSEDRPGKGVIFLLSDGEGLEGDPFGREIETKLRGLEVWTFLVGTEEGGSIPVEGEGQIRTYGRPDLLKDIAASYGGNFFNLSEAGWWERFSGRFSHFLEGEGEGIRYEYAPRNRYSFFLIIGVSCWFLYSIIRVTAWKKEL